MPQTIKIKHNFTNTNVPTTLADAELGYTGFGATHDLYVGNAGVVRNLVSPQRQVEIDGTQTITGEKTIDVGLLKVPGGAAGDALTTDGAGNLAWTPVASDYTVPIADAFPATPAEGTLHFLSSDASLYIYYQGQWVEVSAAP